MTPEQLNNLYKSADAIRNVGNNPVTTQLNNQINQPVNTPNPVQQSKPSNAAYYKYENFAAQQEASNFARRTPYYTTPTQPNAPTPQPPSGAPPTDITNAGKINQIANWVTKAAIASQAIAIGADMYQNPNSYNGKDIVGTAGSVANQLDVTGNIFGYTNPLFNILNTLDNIFKAEKAKTRQTSPNPATPNIPAQTQTTNAQTCTLAGGCLVKGYINGNFYSQWLVLTGSYVGTLYGHPALFNPSNQPYDGGVAGFSFQFFNASGTTLQTITTQTAPAIPSISATPPLLTTASASYSANTNDDPALSPPPAVPSSPTTPKETAPEGSNGLPQGLYDPALTNGLGLGRTTTNTPPSTEFPRGFNATTDTFKDSVWTRYPSTPPIETDKKTETPAKKEEREREEKKVPLVTPLPYTPPTRNPTTNPTTPNSPNPIDTPSKEELEQAKQFREDVKNDLAKLKLEQLEQKTALDALPLAAVAAFLASNPAAQWVRSNTKAASKEAVCEEFQPDACGYNAVKNQTDPLSNKLDAAQIARDANAAAQSTALANILAKIAEMFEYMKTAFQSTVVDKAISALTLIVTLHNAAMLSTSLVQTLSDTLSLGLATIGIKTPEGNPLDVNTAINQSAENFFKGILGAQNYAVLKESWTKASRIIQSGAAIIYNVRSLYDSARSLNELTGNNVAKIGNALRKDGVVEERSYHYMSENNTQINVAMQKLQNLDDAASTLAAITSETYSVTENFAMLDQQRKDFDKAQKELAAVTGIDNDTIKAKAETAKTVSGSPTLVSADLFKPDI